MSEAMKFIGENWWWMIWPAGAAVEWTADRFDAGIGAIAKRRARKVEHQQKLRELELETRRRQLEAAHPQPVKPTCGCGHDVSFHNRADGTCHERVSPRKTVSHQCPCQGYTGPEPLPAFFAPELDGGLR